MLLKSSTSTDLATEISRILAPQGFRRFNQPELPERLWRDQVEIQKSLRQLERELGFAEVRGRVHQLHGQDVPERPAFTRGERPVAEPAQQRQADLREATLRACIELQLATRVKKRPAFLPAVPRPRSSSVPAVLRKSKAQNTLGLSGTVAKW